MKKTYIKPDINFDSFEVNTNIAQCTSKANSVQNVCSLTVGRRKIFTSSVADCTYAVQDGENTWSLCYYVPLGDNNVFGS